jgi:hypothetical protein
MAQIISISIKGTIKAPLLAYYEEKEDEDLEYFNEVVSLLRDDIYDHIDDMVEEGREIMKENEVRDMIQEGCDIEEVLDEVNISEERFIEIRDEMKEEDLI